VSQAEIDRLFDADKRGLVVKLRDLKLVEEFAGADGRLRFATTEEFFQLKHPVFYALPIGFAVATMLCQKKPFRNAV